jgi:hypothetical protein
MARPTRSLAFFFTICFVLSNLLLFAKPTTTSAASFPNIVGNIPIASLGEVAVNSFTNRLYGIINENSALRQVVMIDGANNQVMNRLDIDNSSYNDPQIIRVNSVNNRVYVPYANLQKTYIIDGNTNQVIKIAPVGVFSDMAIDGVGGRIYTVNNQCLFPNGHTEIKSWDADMNLIASAVISGCSGRIGVSHRLNTVYVADGTGLFQVIDAASLSIITTIQVLLGAAQMSVDELNNKIYLTAPNDLQVIDGNTNTIVKQVNRNATQFYENVFNSTTGNVYLAGLGDSGANSIFRYNLAADTLDAGSVTGVATKVTINPTTNYVYLNSDSGLIVLKDEVVTGPPSSNVAKLALDFVGNDTITIQNRKYSPNPFNIFATVTNIGTATASEVLITLQNLPTGLSLAKGSAPSTIIIGNLASGAKKTVSWSVTAVPQNSDTTLNYSIIAIGKNADPVAKNQQLTLPGITRKVVVLLQGVCSDIDKGTSTNDSDSPFVDLQKTLKKEYGFKDNDFLLYSYNGGTVQKDGKWYHNKYGKNDPVTKDFTTNSISTLDEQMLAKYRQANPEATFILVGHSLGGMVAMEEIYKKVSLPDYQLGTISAVITIDSPLHGVVPEALNFLVAPSCATQGVSAGRVVGLHNNEPNTTNTLLQVASIAKQKKVKLLNVGNTRDCLWEPAWCGALIPLGNSDTQWIFNSDADTKVIDLPKPCLNPTSKCVGGTHIAVLSKDYSPNAIKTIADYIGRQN